MSLLSRTGVTGRFSVTTIAFALLPVMATASLRFVPHDETDDQRAWAFEAGVAFITDDNVHEVFFGKYDIEGSAAGGEIYTFTASRRLGELHWEVGGREFRPQLEVPFTLEIVDENSRSPFLDYNASFMIRWVDFPWNRHVRTSFATGVGLSYSEKIYLMDIQRHPGEDRSHLKFNWPIQLTFAAPRYPDHQLNLFLSHQSGGHIFDEGGVNSIGIGYRFGF